MYMKRSEKLAKLLSGEIVKFTQHEVWNILSYLEEYGINMIKIQKTINGEFFCKVDDNTVKCFENR